MSAFTDLNESFPKSFRKFHLYIHICPISQHTLNQYNMLGFNVHVHYIIIYKKIKFIHKNCNWPGYSIISYIRIHGFI